MQQFLPIVILSKLYNSALSPTHELSPIDTFHGYVTLEDALIFTFLPIFAPNKESMNALHLYAN